MSFFLPRIHHPRLDSTHSNDPFLSPDIEGDEVVESKDLESAMFEKPSQWSSERNNHSYFSQVWTAIPRWSTRRKVLRGGGLAVAAFFLVGLGMHKMPSESSSPFEELRDERSWIDDAPWAEDVLLGPPTTRFRGLFLTPRVSVLMGNAHTYQR